MGDLLVLKLKGKALVTIFMVWPVLIIFIFRRAFAVLAEKCILRIAYRYVLDCLDCRRIVACLRNYVAVNVALLCFPERVRSMDFKAIILMLVVFVVAYPTGATPAKLSLI
ncbi:MULTISPECIES: hypothetical protein [unclassified Xanthomonas]|uniref:hypothetical protein n=1 Tax=Xanthomonas sp. LMG 8992 TaxID=1591157 RepID=UPI00136D8EF5|nr:hypothetical protein [Xanthomonas sp. LMG 8992]